MRRRDPVGPLDEIMGTVGTVRVLRALAYPGHARWSQHLVFLTKLSRSSVWDALNRLQAANVVEAVQDWYPGTSAPFRIHRSHPLARLITVLFDAEMRAYPDTRQDFDLLGSRR